MAYVGIAAPAILNLDPPSDTDDEGNKLDLKTRRALKRQYEQVQLRLGAHLAAATTLAKQFVISGRMDEALLATGSTDYLTGIVTRGLPGLEAASLVETNALDPSWLRGFLVNTYREASAVKALKHKDLIGSRVYNSEPARAMQMAAQFIVDTASVLVVAHSKDDTTSFPALVSQLNAAHPSPRPVINLHAELEALLPAVRDTDELEQDPVS